MPLLLFAPPLPLQVDPSLPALDKSQRQSVCPLVRCLAGHPHMLDWLQRQVGGQTGLKGVGETTQEASF
jgi:hypothetical protein